MHRTRGPWCVMARIVIGWDGHLWADSKSKAWAVLKLNGEIVTAHTKHAAGVIAAARFGPKGNPPQWRVVPKSQLYRYKITV